MLTARERMLRDIKGLLSRSKCDKNLDQLKNIVQGYRVQIKPDAQNEARLSARAHLIDSIQTVWHDSEPETRSRKLEGLMGKYRMQVKQSRSRKAIVDPIVAVVPVEGHQGKRKAKASVTPVAGGPKRNQTKRGECPKCHSPGVVAAPELSGESFLACIYCGFQMFEKRRAGGELEYDAASELFGRTFDENDRA